MAALSASPDQFTMRASSIRGVRLTKKFAELGTAPGVLAHYERLDGMGGFMIEDVSQEDTERSYELTLRYSPWIEMEVFPITTIEEAFPVIQRVYG